MHFIIEDLDSHHLFIDGAQLAKITAELEKQLAENIYVPSESVRMGHGKNLRREFDQDVQVGEGHLIARVTELRDKGIVGVSIANADGNEAQSTLAHLLPRFRNVLYLRRGAFVLVAPIEGCGQEAKVQWAIEALLQSEQVKRLRKEGKWPAVFGTPPSTSTSSSSQVEKESSEDSQEEL